MNGYTCRVSSGADTCTINVPDTGLRVSQILEMAGLQLGVDTSRVDVQMVRNGAALSPDAIVDADVDLVLVPRAARKGTLANGRISQLR